MTAPELIKHQGYPEETHYTVTDDGYILQMHRIPYGREGPSKDKRPVAFLQHGVLDSSATWVINLHNQSLAFILADQGFDVWLGNIRGNTYSSNHSTLSTKDKAFWDFTFDEMAEIDLPAQLYYVLKKTGVDDLMYVGHSQGTEIAFIEFSRNHELAKHINFYVALAPVARITHVEGFFSYLANMVPTLLTSFEILGIESFMPSSKWLAEFAIIFCPFVHEDLCEEITFLVAGPDYGNLNTTRIPVYGSHFPSGTSVKNMLHWYQIYTAKTLQAFDFGSAKENILHYNSSTPPQYNVSQLNVPTMFAAGGNDYLGDPRDVAWLEAQLAPGVIIHNLFLDDYNHLDLIWGLDAPQRVYTDILKMAKRLGVY